VTTLHGRQDLADHMPFYSRFSDMPLISISNVQRAPLPPVNFVGTVYHGLPLDLHKPTWTPAGGYLAFLGRISPEKRPDRAIAIARAAGLPLKIAAKVDKVDEAYFQQVITPLLDGTGVKFVGEIDESAKAEFLGQAAGLLFPVDWPEPFGLVMIEAMACGTPVLAFRCGSVPEIVEDRMTGRIVSSVDEAVQAIPELLALDRRAIRARFEERFSSRRMASDYVRIYHSIIRTHGAPQMRLSVIPALSVKAARGFEASSTATRRAAFEQAIMPVGEGFQNGSAGGKQGWVDGSQILFSGSGPNGSESTVSTAKGGRGGKRGKVESRKQAIVIGLSKAGKMGKRGPKTRTTKRKT
jgi:hypothetical protein